MVARGAREEGRWRSCKRIEFFSTTLLAQRERRRSGLKGRAARERGETYLELSLDC
jgi:hypothetical protein